MEMNAVGYAVYAGTPAMYKKRLFDAFPHIESAAFFHRVVFAVNRNKAVSRDADDALFALVKERIAPQVFAALKPQGFPSQKPHGRCECNRGLSRVRQTSFQTKNVLAMLPCHTALHHRDVRRNGFPVSCLLLLKAQFCIDNNEGVFAGKFLRIVRVKKLVAHPR
jgi:hypothetical protein